MQISPSANVVVPRAELTVTFANWTDSSEPLSYIIFVDGAVSSPMGVSTSRVISAPAAAGAHTLRARIADASGNFTELTHDFTVDATPGGWRSFYFGSPLNAGNAADAADPDADGNSNLFEFVAGLHPANNASRFTQRVTAVPNQPGQKQITFGPVIPGRIYTVKYTGSLANPNWSSLANFSSSDSGSERTITDLSAGPGPRFYRVEVRIP